MENEIKNSITYLSNKTGKKSGFSVPSNYFKNLEEEITIKISEQSFSKNNSFNVPPNYFNTIENSILEKVTSTETETKVISISNKILKTIPYIAAASVALFITLNTFVFNSQNSFNTDSISDDEFENWLDVSFLKTDDIVIVLEDDIIDTNEFSFTSLEDETIEDYISFTDNISIYNEFD